jgi:hypothetical protein
MGLIQDNDTLTEAAIQEMMKIPFGKAGTQNKCIGRILYYHPPKKKTKTFGLNFQNPFRLHRY